MRFVRKRACRRFQPATSSDKPYSRARHEPCWWPWSFFRERHESQRVTVALAPHDGDLALARLVLSLAAVDSIRLEIGRANVAAEVGAINFGRAGCGIVDRLDRD